MDSHIGEAGEDSGKVIVHGDADAMARIYEREDGGNIGSGLQADIVDERYSPYCFRSREFARMSNSIFSERRSFQDRPGGCHIGTVLKLKSFPRKRIRYIQARWFNSEQSSESSLGFAISNGGGGAFDEPKIGFAMHRFPRQ
jgi:hypothetical protein